MIKFRCQYRRPLLRAEAVSKTAPFTGGKFRVFLNIILNNRQIARIMWSRNAVDDPLRIRYMNCTVEPLCKHFQFSKNKQDVKSLSFKLTVN